MLSIGKYKKRIESGDTIVEVLIVLAVLSFAFAIATSTAARGLRQSRVAQEHSYAQGLLTSQLEQLKRLAGDPAKSGDLKTNGIEFCMVEGVPKDVTAADFLTKCANDQNDTKYEARVKYFGATATSPDAYYELQVGWDGQGDLGKQREIMRYRVHKVSKTVNPGVVLTAGQPAISVKVYKVKPVSLGTITDDTDILNPSSVKTFDKGVGAPTCGDATNPANLENRNGATVTLQQTNGINHKGPIVTGATTPSIMPASTAIFNQLLTENGTYVANMTPPTGFTACTPNPSTAVTAKGGTVEQIEMYFIPQCKTETKTYSKKIYSDPYTDHSGDEMETVVTAWGAWYRSTWVNHTNEGNKKGWYKDTSPYSTKPDEFYEYNGTSGDARQWWWSRAFADPSNPKYSDNEEGPFYVDWYAARDATATEERVKVHNDKQVRDHLRTDTISYEYGTCEP